jgi:hypothetical protein
MIRGGPPNLLIKVSVPKLLDRDVSQGRRQAPRNLLSWNMNLMAWLILIILIVGSMCEVGSLIRLKYTEADARHQVRGRSP